MGASTLRTALIASGALAAALFAAPLAAAQDSVPAVGDIDFSDPQRTLRTGEGAVIDLSVNQDRAARFSSAAAAADEADASRAVEFALAAGGGDAPVDVAIAQRAALGADASGDLNRRASGSELRVGRGLVRERGAQNDASVYMFVASDDEALTWQPGARSEFGGRGAALAVEDRVEIGDLSAGVTYERNGVQASLAYVEREESARVGNQSFSQDEAFTGVTVTMRR
jgi:hypothetical protein